MVRTTDKLLRSGAFQCSQVYRAKLSKQNKRSVVYYFMYGVPSAYGTSLTTTVGTSHTSISDIGLLNFDLLKTFSGNASSILTLSPPIVLSNYASAANAFLSWMKNGNRTGILAAIANYSNYQAFPNASALDSPWEVHVAPPVK